VSDDRTEQPTSKKLRDARRKGQVLRSRDVHDVAQLGAVLLALGWFGRPLVEGLGRSMAAALVEVGASAHRPISDADLSRLAMQAGMLLAILVGPIAIAAIIGGLAATSAQGGWTLTTEPLTLNFAKLSPAAGLKRLAPSKAGLDLVRTLLAMTGLIWIAINTVQAMVQDSTTLGRISTAQAALLAWNVAESYLRRAWVVMALLAGGDYLLQRFRFMQGLRMTKQEVKDEMRMTEGSPEIKARIRKAQRAMARKRMLAAVPKATVVVTNPTHVAVALEYKREAMFAPKVVAKGADHMAARIKAVAKEHNVPIVENVALARGLYANAEVGDTIPGDLFEAVAEVLAYLIKLKQLVF
jgi:flagellar biosynthetic protein FlhB